MNEGFDINANLGFSREHCEGLLEELKKQGYNPKLPAR